MPAAPKSGETRREFLNEIAGSALGIAGLGSVIVTYQYLSPNVLFEPPTTFRAGNPDLYPLEFGHLPPGPAGLHRADGAGLLRGLGRLHAPGLHHAVEAGS